MAKCPYCGKDNPGYVIYCGSCGTEIPPEARSAPPGPQTVEEEASAPAEAESPPEGIRPAQRSPPAMIRCMYCGAEQEEGRAFCPFCGREPRGPWRGFGPHEDTPSYSEVQYPAETSGTLMIGGVLAIIAGVLALGQGLLYTVVGGSVSYVPESGFLCMCGGLDILFGLASIFGGVFAIQRKNFVFAVLGAVLGMLGLGLMIGALLGLIALIIIASSRNEFHD